MNVVIETAHATFRAETEYGRPVTFEVRVRTVNVSQHSGWSRNMQSRYVVGLDDLNYQAAARALGVYR